MRSTKSKLKITFCLSQEIIINCIIFNCKMLLLFFVNLFRVSNMINKGSYLCHVQFGAKIYGSVHFYWKLSNLFGKIYCLNEGILFCIKCKSLGIGRYFSMEKKPPNVQLHIWPDFWPDFSLELLLHASLSLY